VLQCVVVCCSVLQRVAVCSSGALCVHFQRLPGMLLQCVAACCSVVQRVAVCCIVLQRVLTSSRYVLQCVAVCCSVFQCVAVCCSVLQRVTVCCSVLQCVVNNNNDKINDES